MTMPELAAGFQSLPPEYQAVIRRAQDQHGISITPLDLLVGGWSGAVVYLVSVSSGASNLVEHCILKLDRKGKSARSDEVTRHSTVVSKSTPAFARDHIAELVFDRIEQEGAMAIFYRIAGQSLLRYRPLANYERQSQLKIIFSRTNQVLNKWNVDAVFQQAIHPQTVLKKWLGFRLDPGGNIERFIQHTCRLDPDIPGFLISGHVFPNPLLYARKPEQWGKIRPMDIAMGFIHGDLNTNNILVKFSEDKESLEGYYLIDFALFKEGSPLLYDQRYLEMSYLLQALSQISFVKCINFLTLMAVADIPDPHKVPIETSGISAVIASAREAFVAWVRENHPSLHDDLWGQYWLAGVAAGLSYCHKPGLPDEQRLAGLIFAAANLKRYTALFPLPRPSEVRQLYDENGSMAAAHPGRTVTSDSGGQHNLPHQPTPFIGRTTQITALKELLLHPDVHLITLIGPGGTGKTRLSLEAAQAVMDQFADGVFFVPLADDTDANQVISRVAQHLEVREGGRSLLENVKDYLRDKSLLLVMDNFEQLVSAVPVVAELLATAPQLKIMSSSRVALNLHGEREFPVPPMELPQIENLLHAKDLAGNEAVSLFIERARSVQPGFALTEDNASAVAEICRRLDGLPLALELAAARVKFLPPQAILARLDDRLKLLTGGARDLPARQRTLRSTLDWSYGLLDPQERTLYARLAVFIGGFNLETAEAICNPENSLDILEGVASLVNNSLLRQELTNGSEPRFRMLETIREYALERLVESGEMDALQRGHTLYYANIVKEAGYELFGAKAYYWLKRLDLEYDNIRAALVWSQTTTEGIELGPPLVTFLNWYWYRRGFFSEGRMWTERVLASPALTTPGPEKAIMLQMSGLLAMWQGDLNIAVARARQGLELTQKFEDEQSMPWTLMGTGVVLINMGKDSEAHALLKEAQALFKEAGFNYMQATALVHLGNVALGLGDPIEAGEWLDRAHTIFREIGEAWGLSFVLNNLGEVARVMGDYDQAGKYYVESEALLRATGDKGDVARFVHNLGYVALHKEDFQQAETQFQESLSMFRKLGNKRGIAECIAGFASLRAKQTKLIVGANLLGAAEALLGASGAAWWPADRAEVEKTRALIRSALGEAEFKRALAEGQEMSLEQAIAFVSNV